MTTPRSWPALDVPGADDLVLAALDDFSPTAVEELASGARVFFATTERRDAAQSDLLDRRIAVTAIDVPDDDWAARSQQNLSPLTVGGIMIQPDPRSISPSSAPIQIIIEPSMGFGTGHHATTRLCLAALQDQAVAGASVLDVGTGSGILAIAAARLGAEHVHAIDVDADAIQSADANLVLNPAARNVTFAVADLTSVDLPPADIVLANLTGAMLGRTAGVLLAALEARGTLIISGILASEETEVREAFSTADCRHRAQEDEWVCLTLRKR